jgi:hypothetical protein
LQYKGIPSAKDFLGNFQEINFLGGNIFPGNFLEYIS